MSVCVCVRVRVRACVCMCCVGVSGFDVRGRSWCYVCVYECVCMRARLCMHVGM